MPATNGKAVSVPSVAEAEKKRSAVKEDAAIKVDGVTHIVPGISDPDLARFMLDMNRTAAIEILRDWTKRKDPAYTRLKAEAKLYEVKAKLEADGSWKTA